MPPSQNLKIVFLCGCLEQGKDGVGDYVIRLAAELISTGHQVMAIALNDQYLNSPYAGNIHYNGISLPIIREPANQQVKTRFAHAKKQIDEFDPDWLSLQFVPFAFNAKGLTFGLSKLLGNLGKGRQWHIMFHELWVGMEIETTQKLIWWGRAQRLLIKSLITNLKPKLIHTQTELYRSQLAQLGFQSAYLPLFSNIPVVQNTTGTDATPGKIIKLLVFGEIHLGAPVEYFASEAAAYENENEVKFVLTFLGRSSKSERDRWKKVWQRNGMEVAVLGERPATEIAAIFKDAQLGISLTAFAVSDKSGSLAAMKACGLKILCVSRPWTPRGIKKFEQPQGVFEYRAGNFAEFMHSEKSNAQVTTAALTAGKLINDLLQLG